jgi:hypothetical protein
VVLGVAGHPKFKAALAEDEVGLAQIAVIVLYSPADAQAVLALDGNAAQFLLDIIQQVSASTYFRLSVRLFCRRWTMAYLCAMVVPRHTGSSENWGKRATSCLPHS